MEKMNDLRALLQHEVQDLVSAEDQIIDAMPAMISKVKNGELKKILEEHLVITQTQRKRLDDVLTLLDDGENKGFLAGLLDKFTSPQKCKGMEGIITEGEKVLGADMDADVKDAAIIASAQKIEHYEICGYGTVKAYARELNLPKVEALLDQTLNEEYDADDKLTNIAVGGINEKAEGRSGANRRGRSNGKKVAAKKSSTAKKPASKSAATKKSAAKKTVAKKSASKK